MAVLAAAAGAEVLATEMGSDDLSVGNGKTADGEAASAVAALADRSPMANKCLNVMTRPKKVKTASRWVDSSTGSQAGIVLRQLSNNARALRGEAARLTARNSVKIWSGRGDSNARP